MARIQDSRFCVAVVSRIALVCVLLGLLCGPLFAQTTSAVISGRVIDPTGAVVPGASIELKSTETGVVQRTLTNGDGLYTLPNVNPGTYVLSVTKQGFRTVNATALTVYTQDQVSRNFKLEVGSATESVTVNGDAELVSTSAAVSTVVDQTYVKNMPLNGRSFQDLILLTPGVVTQSPQNSGNVAFGQAGEFSVNGQRQESNAYIVDGVSANVGAASGANMIAGGGASGSLPAATALGTTQALVSVDALQEFRVQGSTYSAEYGRNPGGQFAFETKSGTNQWHGTAYDYLRNGALDAHDWFNDYFNLPQPAIRQNDFGGTLGGPVSIPRLYKGKDKTFFFVSYEGLRLTSPQPACANCFVPDAALRASAPPVLQPLLNTFPQQSPNGIDNLATGLAQFIGSGSNPSSLDSTGVRLDHVVNEKLRLFFRFSDTASSSATQGIGSFSPALVTTSSYTIRTYTGGVSTLFTNHLSNELRLNYTSNAAVSNQAITNLGGNTPTDLRQLLGLGPDSQPLFFLLLGGKAMISGQIRANGTQRQWNIVDSVNLSLGRHQFKFGVDYRRLTPFDTPSSPQVQFLYTSKSAVQNNAALARTTVFAPAYPLYTNFSAFAQDNWRVSQRLNVSLGLRWEVNPPPGVTQGLMPYTVQGTNFSNYALAPQGTPLWQTTWFNFAPRAGIAYVLSNRTGREMVVRGGAGVFFDTGQQVASGGFLNGPGFNGSSGFKVMSFPSYPAIPTIVNPPTNSTSVYGFYPHLQLPYTLQWNASIEQALGKSHSLTVSYVGSHAARLLQENNLSISNNPKLSSFTFIENGLTSDYDALQTQFRRRLSRGFTMLGSYTWSHCLDYGSQNYNFSAQRGNCSFDVRHNLSTAFSYDLPNVGRNRFSNAVLHHWGLDDRLSARTAFPVTLGGNQLIQPDGRSFFAGLDVVPNQPIYLYGANCASVLQGLNRLKPGQGCPGGRAVDPNAFAQVPSDPNTGNPTRQGTAPRNFVRGFGAWQMNLAVRREFPIHENLRLQFRAEAFNIFNHPSFGFIDPSLSSPTFGEATGTLAGSLGNVNLNSLYQAGGPRSMQFALKFVF